MNSDKAGKITRPPSLVFHVTDGVNVDEQSDPGHYQEHHLAEIINLVTNPDLEDAEVDPIETGVWFGPEKTVRVNRNEIATAATER